MKLLASHVLVCGLAAASFASVRAEEEDGPEKRLPLGRPLTDFRPGKRSMAVGRQEFRPGKRFVAEGGDGGLLSGEDIGHMLLKRSMAIGRQAFRPGKRSMAIGRQAFRPGKRSMAIGRQAFRPGKRSMALGRLQFRPGKRSMALGRFNFRPGKRSDGGEPVVVPDTCEDDELEKVAYVVHDLLTILEQYSDYIYKCEGPITESELESEIKAAP